MQRKSGVLMPIFSLPSKYGIGDFGLNAYKFIDFLKKSGQSIWQILPIVQTGYGNSPYSSVCSYSFNPFFISIETLYKNKLIERKDLEGEKDNSKYIDYGKLYFSRYALLRKAFVKFDKTDKDFLTFCKDADFKNYALFMTLSEKNNGNPFYLWEEDYKRRNAKALKKLEKENCDSVLFWLFVQFEARREWVNLKEYANKNGVKIMGDMPLYVSENSVDVWVHPELFNLNEDLKPKKVAGVPPDYFCSEGQLWGNPVYNYEVHEQDGFSWWTKRLKKVLKIYDYVRIDHFRGLDRFYQVDASKSNAVNGEWITVPSLKLFDAIHKSIDKNRIIAEDLGIIDDGVRELLKTTGYPGMKILSFAFNGEKDNLYLPEAVTENSVCYTGTHDNDTLLGLISSSSEWDKNNIINGVRNSLKVFGMENELSDNVSIANAIIELGFRCKSNLFILPFSDLLLLGSDYRINVPGKVLSQNWAVKYDFDIFNLKNAQKLKTLTKKYNR